MPSDIRAVIAAMQPRVRKAFTDAIADIKSEAQLAVIVRALEDGRIEDALRAMALDEAFFAPLDDALRAAYIQGGRDALAGLPVIPDRAGLGKWLSASMGATRGRKRG